MLPMFDRLRARWRKWFPPPPPPPICTAAPGSVEWLEHTARWHPSPYAQMAASKTLASRYRRMADDARIRKLLREELARLEGRFVSCRCPAGYGHPCPLSSDECSARVEANRREESGEGLRCD